MFFQKDFFYKLKENLVLMQYTINITGADIK